MDLSAVPTGVSEALMRGDLWTDSVGVEATYVVTVFVLSYLAMLHHSDHDTINPLCEMRLARRAQQKA